MMYQGIDLSRFKKIAGDGKTSTLRHAKGHEIKIAHSSLSPAIRDHIGQMPVHMAEGGDAVADEPEEPAEAPETADAPEAAESPAPAEAAAEAPEAPPEEPAASAPADNGLPPKPAVMPQAGTIDVIAPRTTAQDLDNEDALYAQDAERGHIKPETMAELFAKKSTLGKIGTIFGLILSGAGSGLAHQQNAAFGMMQKEIDNDLEAQKASSQNAQNYLRLSHEHQLQKLQTAKLAAETGEIPSRVALNKAQAAHADADAGLIALNSAKTKMQIGAYQHLIGMHNKMPPGPQKDKALQVLTTDIAPAILNDAKTRNAKTEAQINLRSAVRGDVQKAPPADNPAGVDFDKLNTLAQQGQMAESLNLPGGMRGADVSSANAEAQKVSDNRAIAAIYHDSFNKLDKMALAGKMNPKMRDAEINSLGAQVARATAGRYNEKEAAAQAAGMFPEVADWGSARDEKFRKAMEYFQAEEAGTPTLDRFGLKTPFPEYKREKTAKSKTTAAPAKSEAKASPKDGQTGTFAGKPVVFRSGKWVYK